MRHLCEHTSFTHFTASTKYTCGLSIGINILLGFSNTIWACSLSMSAANGRDFTVRYGEALTIFFHKSGGQECVSRVYHFIQKYWSFAAKVVKGNDE